MTPSISLQCVTCIFHNSDVIMTTMASQITSLAIVYPTVCSDADQRKHQSSASLAFVRGIHREPVNSPHKWPVTRKMFPFHDVIMIYKLTDPNTRAEAIREKSRGNVNLNNTSGIWRSYIATTKGITKYHQCSTRYKVHELMHLSLIFCG